MKVLLAAAEMSPLARTGGLGEAVAGLAAALAGKGVEVGVAMPRYRHLLDLGEPVGPAGPAQLVYRHQQGEVTVLLVDDPPAFDRQGIYGPVPGTGYADEWWRWGRFSRAVVAMVGGVGPAPCPRRPPRARLSARPGPLGDHRPQRRVRRHGASRGERRPPRCGTGTRHTPGRTRMVGLGPLSEGGDRRRRPGHHGQPRVRRPALLWTQRCQEVSTG